MDRRWFLRGASAAVVSAPLAAPAIVRAASLMKVWVPKLTVPRGNALLSLHEITREAGRLWMNSNMFLQQYDDEFAVAIAKIGQELRIRLPENYRIA